MSEIEHREEPEAAPRGLSVRKKVLFSVITTVLTFAVLNGVFVLRDKQQHGVTQTEKEALYQQTSTGRKVLKAGAVMKGSSTSIRTNSIGFRGPDLLDPKPENGFRIWVVGGSTTFDVYAPDDARTWPALMGKRLGELHPERVVEVINAGIPGEVIAGNIEDFKKHADTVQPDLLVYYHGPNDLRDIRFGGPPPPTGALEREFALLRAARGAVNKRYPQLPDEWSNAQVSSHDLNELTRRIELLLEQARIRNIPVLMANHAFQYTNGKTGSEALGEIGEICVLMQMAPDNVVHMFRDYNTLVQGIAERKSIPFADVRSAVPSDARYWGDSLHFSAEGSELAAAVFVEAVEAGGFF